MLLKLEDGWTPNNQCNVRNLLSSLEAMTRGFIDVNLLIPNSYSELVNNLQVFIGLNIC